MLLKDKQVWCEITYKTQNCMLFLLPIYTELKLLQSKLCNFLSVAMNSFCHKFDKFIMCKSIKIWNNNEYVISFCCCICDFLILYYNLNIKHKALHNYKNNYCLICYLINHDFQCFKKTRHGRWLTNFATTYPSKRKTIDFYDLSNECSKNSI